MVTINDPSVPSSTGLPPAAGTRPSGSGNGPADGAHGVVHDMAQGAHQTIDRLAEQVGPHVQRLHENMASATGMLDERADQFRALADEWVASLRTTVRDNPLAAVGTALAIGMLVARLSR